MGYDCIIIGAGLAGLNAGYELGKKGKRVLILEKDDDIGGVMASYRFPEFTI